MQRTLFHVIQEGAGYGYKYSTGRNGQEDESSSKCAIPVSFKISFFYYHQTNVDRLLQSNFLRVSAAEKIPTEDASAQLIVACMAAHWFDLTSFFKEAERVLCDNGIVAVAAFFLPIMVHPDSNTSYGLNKALEDVITNIFRLFRYRKTFICEF